MVLLTGWCQGDGTLATQPGHAYRCRRRERPATMEPLPLAVAALRLGADGAMMPSDLSLVSA